MHSLLRRFLMIERPGETPAGEGQPLDRKLEPDGDLALDLEGAPVIPHFCLHCGAESPRGSRRCFNCQQPLGGPLQEEHDRLEYEKKQEQLRQQRLREGAREQAQKLLSSPVGRRIRGRSSGEKFKMRELEERQTLAKLRIGFFGTLIALWVFWLVYGLIRYGGRTLAGPFAVVFVAGLCFAAWRFRRYLGPLAQILRSRRWF